MAAKTRRDPGARRRWRKGLAFGAALALGFGSMLVLADWLATGTGTGSARARVALDLQTETVSASDTLYPGGSGDLVLRVRNPNPYPVTLSSVHQNGSITSDQVGCDATNHGVSMTDQTGLALSVPGSAAQTFTLTGAVAMASTSATECQGATFTIPVSLNGPAGETGGGDGGGDVPACDDGDPDTVDFYDEANDTCVFDYYPVGTACDDGDPNTFNDMYDGIGNCYGQPGTTFYRDADNDTYGSDDTTVIDSSAPQGYVSLGGDCNDSDPSVNPGATEVAGNEVDDDCDAQVDEP